MIREEILQYIKNELTNTTITENGVVTHYEMNVQKLTKGGLTNED